MPSGTQLLCEQVIGRALRRQSYVLNDDDRFNVEYADVLGIPFDFTKTRNQGIIGEGVDLNLEHLEETRASTVLFHLTRRLLETRWRDKVLLDSYNPLGSTSDVRFNTSRAHRWQTDPARCHVNWVVLDSDWEAELCRVAESHPRVRAYVKNHNLGLEVPYRHGSETRRYLPDFVVLVDDGHGDDDLLHLVVEIKGYRREDAKEKKLAMDSYWIPGVNNLGTLGRWAFAELREIYRIESDFEAKVSGAFDELVSRAGTPSREVSP